MAARDCFGSPRLRRARSSGVLTTRLGGSPRPGKVSMPDAAGRRCGAAYPDVALATDRLDAAGLQLLAQAANEAAQVRGAKPRIRPDRLGQRLTADNAALCLKQRGDRSTFEAAEGD